jgi:ribosomal protein L11 methyltransferase
VLTDVPAREFDVILANINRNVLLDNMSLMAQRMVPGGILLLSGILDTDFDVIVESASAEHLKLTHKMQQGDWLCLSFVK